MPVQSSPESFRDVTYTYGLPGEELDIFINRFIAAAADDPFSSWLILPTKRLVLSVTESLVAKNIPFHESRICTLEDFCRIIFEENRTTERALLRSEPRLLLREILEDPGIKVPLFITGEHPSSGTIADLVTFTSEIRMRRIAFPECLLQLQSTKSDQLDTIITQYRNRLNELELADSESILEWTIDFINRHEPPQPGAVFIYGFHEPLPLEQDLFDALCGACGSVSFYIPDGRDRNIFCSRAAAGGEDPGVPAVPGPSASRAAVTGLFSETGIFKEDDFFHVRTFPSRYEEAYGIAAEICRLNALGTPLFDIAVIFPDLHGGDYGIIEEVFREFKIPWNSAVSPRFFRAPVIQFLIGLAGLAAGGYRREDLVRITGSPYFRNSSGTGGFFRADATETDLVSRYAQVDGPHPSWGRQLDRLAGELSDPKRAKEYPGITVAAVERVRDGISSLKRDLDPAGRKSSLRDRTLAFLAFLESWQIPYFYRAPDEPTKEREIQAYKKFCSRLEALGNCAWLAGKDADAAEFLRFIVSVAEEPDESGLADSDGVAVIGHKECQHLRFPVVFVGGLVEGTFPRLVTRLPFTNSLENAKMGTRTLAEILREEQYYFITAILSAQRTVYISAPLADGIKPLLTSAFFERVRMRTGSRPWPDLPEGAQDASRRTAAVRAGSVIGSGEPCRALATIPDSQEIDELVGRINMERFWRRGSCDSAYDGILSGNEAIRAALGQRYGPEHVYSPTSLEIYATCPFAYFLDRVIRLLALPEVEPNLSPGDRGTAIHNVLSAFFREWQAAGKGRITPASLVDATDLILRLAKDELQRYSFQSPLWDATRILMLGDPQTGPGYFERFLENEAAEGDSPLVPTRFEYSFGMGAAEPDDPASVAEPVELAAPDGGRKIFIHGRIDRIDLTPDGLFVIYDYKSGSTHPRAKDILDGTALQLPLYLLAFEKISGNHGIGGGYYTIRREVGRSMVLADPCLKDLMVSHPRASGDFAGTILHARTCAFDYAEGIRTGQFPLPAKEECPNAYCDYARICRFNPYRIFETGEGA
jgi:ATP-dependent helicase/DNAse subunit B